MAGDNKAVDGEAYTDSKVARQDVSLLAGYILFPLKHLIALVVASPRDYLGEEVKELKKRAGDSLLKPSPLPNPNPAGNVGNSYPNIESLFNIKKHRQVPLVKSFTSHLLLFGELRLGQ